VILWIKFNNFPTRCELRNLLYYCSQLYTFRVLTHIIRRSYNYKYSSCLSLACVCVCVHACMCACVYWDISTQKLCNVSCFPYKNIKPPSFHTLTIYCTKYKALSFNKIAVKWFTSDRKWLGQVTSTRTMENASNNHMVGVTADKNITWLLEQRVKSCSGLSWLRIWSCSRILNTVVNEISSSYSAAYEGHCHQLCDCG